MSIHFVIKNIFTKSPKIFLYHNQNVIGHSTFSIVDMKTACINNLFIEPDYRKKKYGSKLLQNTENILKKYYHKEKCTLLVHELPCDNLQHFYKSNGYSEQLNRNVRTPRCDIYDDGSNIFTLVPMYKQLNRFDYK